MFFSIFLASAVETPDIEERQRRPNVRRRVECGLVVGYDEYIIGCYVYVCVNSALNMEKSSFCLLSYAQYGPFFYITIS